MPVDLRQAALKCPCCGNDDKALMVVYTMDWHRVSDMELVGDAERALPDERDTVQCECPLDDEFDPVCNHRDAVESFALCAAGVNVAPTDNSAEHGSHRAPPPPAEEAPDGAPPRRRAVG